jgi:hypothetical protein
MYFLSLNNVNSPLREVVLQKNCDIFEQTPFEYHFLGRVKDS